MTRAGRSGILYKYGVNGDADIRISGLLKLY
jgi:hypothetical protein